ncbi:MAG TPA: 1,4-beta-xylanase, partial [Verrucomicrobiae bacterium]
RNIWAPEWIYDSQDGSYFIFWSSSFEHEGWQKSRLWYARTKDWQTSTPAKEFFHPAYSVIDGTLWEHAGHYYLFHKEEEFGAEKGERRAVRLAQADQLAGPYHVFPGPLNGGQISPVIAEGPEIMTDPQQAGWLLIYDYCMSNGYGVSSSPDLLHWSVESSVTFPPDARHGCFAPLTEADAKRLHERFDHGQ